MNEDNSLKLAAANRAIAWLRASGLQFAVQMPDGSYVGGPHGFASQGRDQAHQGEQLGRDDRLPQHDERYEARRLPRMGSFVGAAGGFRSAVSSAGTRIFGHGKFITEVKNGKACLLRCE